MIFIAPITEKTGDVFKNLGDHVINTNRIARHNAVDVSSTSFFYTDNLRDRRRKPMPTKASIPPSFVQTQMDTVLTSNIMTLNVFIDNDITKPALPKYINYSDFVYASPHRLNSSYSWVTMVEGFSLTKVLVDDSLAGLVLEAGYGTSTTEGYGDTINYTDGENVFRLQVRDGALYLDEYVGGVWNGVNNWSL